MPSQVPLCPSRHVWLMSTASISSICYPSLLFPTTSSLVYLNSLSSLACSLIMPVLCYITRFLLFQSCPSTRCSLIFIPPPSVFISCTSFFSFLLSSLLSSFHYVFSFYPSLQSSHLCPKDKKVPFVIKVLVQKRNFLEHPSDLPFHT